MKNGNGKPDPGAKREKYRLSFVDDGGQVSEVHKDFVVAVSSGFHDESSLIPNASSLLECHTRMDFAGQVELIDRPTSLLESMRALICAMQSCLCSLAACPANPALSGRGRKPRNCQLQAVSLYILH